MLTITIAYSLICLSRDDKIICILIAWTDQLRIPCTKDVLSSDKQLTVEKRALFRAVETRIIFQHRSSCNFQTFDYNLSSPINWWTEHYATTPLRRPLLSSNNLLPNRP